MRIIPLFFGATEQMKPMAPRFEVSRSHTIRQIYTPGRNSLNELSVRRRVLYLHNTQQTQETNIHDLGGIRNRDASHQIPANLRLRPHC